MPRIFISYRRSDSQAIMGWIRDLVLPFFIKMGAKSMDWVHSYRVEWDRKVA